MRRFILPLGKYLAALLTAALILSGTPAPLAAATPFHDTETLRLNYKVFDVLGSYSKQACSAQANLKSRSGKKMGFAIYWRVGKSLHLLVSHPDNAKVNGSHQVRFLFPDGKKLVFPMARSGNQLQVRIGFGAKGSAFYDALKSNTAVRIDLPAVNDSVDVSLKERERLEAGMGLCRRWLK